jgi:YidC/Oxa1 family membrane protein insertase
MANITSFILYILVNIYQLVGDLGVSIILFTFLTRLVLVPLSFNSLRSQAKMKKLQPKLKELEKKHKGSKEELNKIKMEFYKQHNVNPLSGCLPQVVQIGLLIVLYQVLMKFFKNPDIAGISIQTQFLWMNLSQPDPLYVLPVLAGASQFIMSLMIAPGAETPDLISNQSSSKKVQQANKKEEDAAAMAAMMQKQMIFVMPVMTGFIALRFPSGLALYWIATTVFSIGQQYFVSGFGGLTSYWKKAILFIRIKTNK